MPIIGRLIVRTQTISCLTVRHLTVFWACARRWELELELELELCKIYVKLWSWSWEPLARFPLF